MARPSKKKARPLLWITSLILVASMVCSLSAIFRPGLLFGTKTPTPIPSPIVPWDAVSVTPTPSPSPEETSDTTQSLRDLWAEGAGVETRVIRSASASGA